MEGGVTFRVYDDKGRQVFEKGTEIEGDKAEAEWIYHWNGEKLEEKPKFTFEVTGQRCKKVESSEVEISQKLVIKLPKINNIDNLKADLYRYGNANTEEISFDSDNKYEKEDLIPGKYSIRLKKE
jgi:uncharacterized membrane protein